MNLVGSFNEWDIAQGIPMHRVSTRLFVVTIAVVPSTVLFKFIVDGAWRYDDVRCSRGARIVVRITHLRARACSVNRPWSIKPVT